MIKKDALEKLVESEDAVVTYIAVNSKKQKYNVVTLNFKTPYIKTKRTNAIEDENSILVFSWDMDSFRLINTASIVSIVPLAKVLRNDAW